jgi:hypothetical protein
MYVYANEAGVWTFKQKVQPTDLQTGDQFGDAVAVSRNLELPCGTHERHVRALRRSGGRPKCIGAYNEELPGPDQGANLAAGSAYVYKLQEGAWTYTGQALAAPIPQAVERFGYSVSLNSGWMVIGAPGGGSGGGTSNGSVYQYELQQNGVWLPAGVQVPTDLESGDAFGSSVSVETFVVGGAPKDQLNEAGPFTEEGSVYVAAFE